MLGNLLRGGEVKSNQAGNSTLILTGWGVEDIPCRKPQGPTFSNDEYFQIVFKIPSFCIVRPEYFPSLD